MKYLSLKHDFSFIDQSNGWTLPNDDLDPSLFFRDSLHLNEEGSVRLTKLIINSIALTNSIYFSSNTSKRYSYSDTCKNEASFSFALTLNEADFPPLSPPIQALKCKHITFSNNCNRDLCEPYDSNYVSSRSKPVSTKTVCKPVRTVSSNKRVLFPPVYKTLYIVILVLVKLFVAVLTVNLQVP